MRKLLIAWIFFLLAFASTSLALESDYSRPFCDGHKGQYNYRTIDGTYVDCLTETTAWEVDYAKNWYQCLGQALYYASVTGKRPGCALLIDGDTDLKYAYRLADTIKYWHWCFDVSLVKVAI